MTAVRPAAVLEAVVPRSGVARRLTAVTMMHTLGQGMWLALNAIYAVSVLHLTPGQFGVGVGAGALVALALSTPMGHVADRVGAKPVQVCSFVALAPATAALVLVDSFDAYLAVTAAQAIAYAASRSARLAMIAGVLAPEERVAVRAYLRAASNVSVAVGAGAAGLMLALGSTTAYRAAVVFIAATYLVTGLLSRRLPVVAAQPRKPGAAFAVFRDRPYLTFVLLDGALTSHGLLLDVVLPLWVVQQTHAPRWIIAAILLVNTTLVVLLQVRAARGTDDATSAAKASRGGAAFLCVACLVFACTGGRSAVLASLILLAGAVAHVLGEVRQSAGSWGISFDLAPPDAQGQYLGTHAMGVDVGKVLAPSVFVWLVLQHSAAGWVALAFVFLALGLAMPPVVRWQRSARAA